MKPLKTSRAAVSCSCWIVALALLSVEARAQERPAGRRGLYGDWLIKMDFGGRQMESILSFSRDADGNRKGEWISFMGVSELQELKFEEGKISFTQVRQDREGQTMTSKFTGTIAEGRLSGTIASERGEMKVEGTPLPRVPRVAGDWAVKVKMGEREITTTFKIKAGEGRTLALEWPSERVKHTVSDVNYERGKLTFKTKSKMEEREWESTFEGTIEGDKLSGTLKSQRGEGAVEGTRVGAALIGTWNLDLTSDRGTRKQRLRVHPDLSGYFGAIPVKSIECQGDKVAFKVSVEFGDQKFETSFAGSVKEGVLSGELTSSRGTQKVTGTKVLRRGRQGTRV